MWFISTRAYSYIAKLNKSIVCDSCSTWFSTYTIPHQYDLSICEQRFVQLCSVTLAQTLFIESFNYRLLLNWHSHSLIRRTESPWIIKHVTIDFDSDVISDSSTCLLFSYVYDFFFTLRQMFKNYMKMIRVWLKHEYFVWSKNWVRICGFRNENVLLNCSFIKYAYFHLLAITFAVTYVRWVTSSYVARRIKIYSSSDGNSDILTACELSGLGNKRWFMHVNNIILHKQLARQEVIVHSMGSGFSEFDSNHVFYTC